MRWICRGRGVLNTWEDRQATCCRMARRYRHVMHVEKLSRLWPEANIRRFRTRASRELQEDPKDGIMPA